MYENMNYFVRRVRPLPKIDDLYMVEIDSFAKLYVTINGHTYEICKGDSQKVKLCLDLLDDIIHFRKLGLDVTYIGYATHDTLSITYMIYEGYSLPNFLLEFDNILKTSTGYTGLFFAITTEIRF